MLVMLVFLKKNKYVYISDKFIWHAQKKKMSGRPMQMVDPIVIGKKNQQNLNFKLH